MYGKLMDAWRLEDDVTSLAVNFLKRPEYVFI